MRKPFLWLDNVFLMLFCVVFLSTTHAMAASSTQAVKTLTDGVQAEQQVLTEGQKWEQEKAALSQEIKQAKLESEWYNLHIKTLERYVKVAKENVATLLKTQEELQRLEAALEANLVIAVQQLELFVQKDLPFLPQERESRLAFLRASLDDYTLGLEEKLRRVFEALQVEADYARGFEITDETVETTDGKHAVKLVRIGRVGLFALAPDGTKGWQYTPQGYVPLPEQYVQSLQSLREENINVLPVLPFVSKEEGK